MQNEERWWEVVLAGLGLVAVVILLIFFSPILGGA